LLSIQTRVPAVCHRVFRFPNSTPMQPVVDLVSANRECSGLREKIPPPVSIHRWSAVGKAGDSARSINSSTGNRYDGSGDTGNGNAGQDSGTRYDGSGDAEHNPGSSSSLSSCLPSAVPVRIYAAPVVASKPFIPCFKAAVSAKPLIPTTSRKLCPPGINVIKLFLSFLVF
jgi:hypothetical protein